MMKEASLESVCAYLINKLGSSESFFEVIIEGVRVKLNQAISERNSEKISYLSDIINDLILAEKMVEIKKEESEERVEESTSRPKEEDTREDGPIILTPKEFEIFDNIKTLFPNGDTEAFSLPPDLRANNVYFHITKLKNKGFLKRITHGGRGNPATYIWTDKLVPLKKIKKKRLKKWGNEAIRSLSDRAYEKVNKLDNSSVELCPSAFHILEAIKDKFPNGDKQAFNLSGFLAENKMDKSSNARKGLIARGRFIPLEERGPAGSLWGIWVDLPVKMVDKRGRKRWSRVAKDGGSTSDKEETERQPIEIEAEESLETDVATDPGPGSEPKQAGFGESTTNKREPTDDGLVPEEDKEDVPSFLTGQIKKEDGETVRLLPAHIEIFIHYLKEYGHKEFLVRDGELVNGKSVDNAITTFIRLGLAEFMGRRGEGRAIRLVKVKEYDEGKVPHVPLSPDEAAVYQGLMKGNMPGQTIKIGRNKTVESPDGEKLLVVDYLKALKEKRLLRYEDSRSAKMLRVTLKNKPYVVDVTSKISERV